MSIILSALIVRIHYLLRKSGSIMMPNLGGDPCHHYNIAYNIASGNGPVTNFIYAYWHHHPALPALSDIYPPGTHFFLALPMLIFAKSYFVARMAEFGAGVTSVYFSYLIGKNIFNKKVGLINSTLLAFNIFHIENSTIVMTPVISLLALQIFLFFLFSEKISNKKIILIGLSFSWLILCQNGMELLLPLTIIYLYNTFRQSRVRAKERIIKIVLFVLIVVIGIIPWAYTTYNYFGIPMYSNMKYYPFIDDFSQMMTSTIKPRLDLALSNLDISYIKKLLIWLVKDIFKLIGSQVAYTFILLIPLIPWAYIKTIKNNKSLKIKFLAYSTLIILCASVIGSRALGGQMFPRHFLIFLALTTPIISYGLLELYNLYLQKFNFFTKKIFFICMATFTITTVFINESRHTFWEKDTSALYSAGIDIKELVPKESRIMFASTPQDAWCLTQRNIVGDPNFGFSLVPSYRAKHEISNYNVDYLWIDKSDYIYKRSNVYSDLSIYQGLKLEKIYESKDHLSSLYKINK